MQPTRDRMIEAARAGFQAQGVTATGFTAILERAGAARGAIYHHFPGGKSELVRTVVERTGTDVARLIDGVFESSATGSEALADLLDLFVLAVEGSEGAFGCPVAPAVLEAGEDTSILEAGDTAFRRWRDHLHAGLVAKGADPERAADLAVLFVSTVEGALVLTRAARSAEPLHRVRALLPDLLACTGIA